MKQIDHVGYDLQSIPIVESRKIKRWSQPCRRRTDRVDIVGDRIVVAVADDRYAFREDVTEGKEVEIRSPNGIEHSLKAFQMEAAAVVEVNRELVSDKIVAAR